MFIKEIQSKINEANKKGIDYCPYCNRYNFNNCSKCIIMSTKSNTKIMKLHNLRYFEKVKMNFLLPYLHGRKRILDLGCGIQPWLSHQLKAMGYNVRTFDRHHADITGEFENYKFKEKFDCVIALEFIEHGDYIPKIKSILEKGGLLIVSTPGKRMNKINYIPEKLNLYGGYKRNPGEFIRGDKGHVNLMDIEKDIDMEKVRIDSIFGMHQLGVFRK